MFFTQFPINMTRRESRAMLASPYRMHAAIAGSFPLRRRAGTAACFGAWIECLMGVLAFIS